MPEININKPGTLAHRIDLPTDDQVVEIFQDGLKSRNQLKLKDDLPSYFPDYVSLCMVNRYTGLLHTSTHVGETGRSDPLYYLTFVLDDDYVDRNPEMFIAVGSSLRPGNLLRSYYEERPGRLYHGINFADQSFTGPIEKAFHEEVLTTFLPPEAIVGVAIPQRYITRVLSQLNLACPDRALGVADIHGQILFTDHRLGI